jgi:hypothetical protein
MIHEDLAVETLRCPDCGRLLSRPDSTGLRTLWPRLTVAAVATLLVVIAVGIGLARLLPSTRREQPQPVLAEQTLPATQTEVDKPLASPSPSASLSPDDPPRPKEVLPLAPPSGGIAKLRPKIGGIAKPLDGSNQLEANPQADEEFFQEVVISRRSRYLVLGAEMGQDVQYVLVSRFRVKKKDSEGGMVVEQKVEGVRLSNADPAMQAQLNALLQKTKGATFTLTVNPRREVTKFEGDSEAIQVFAGANPLGGPSFLLWSFLDRDGWKELAEVSFFQPPKSVQRGDKWERPMTHSWGPLGSWAGKVHFQSSGEQAGLPRFDYALDLSYKPPGKGGGLPFDIGKAEFQIQTARGAIAYQPKRRRVAAAEEHFHVRGALAVSLLGMDSVIQMDEAQVFRLRILDRNPLDK